MGTASRGSGELEREPGDGRGRWPGVGRAKRKEGLAVAWLIKKGARDEIHRALGGMKSEHSGEPTQLSGSVNGGKTSHPTRFESRSSSLRGLPRDAQMSGKPPSAPGTHPVLGGTHPARSGSEQGKFASECPLCSVERGVGSPRRGGSQGPDATASRGTSPCLGRPGWCREIRPRERTRHSGLVENPSRDPCEGVEVDTRSGRRGGGPCSGRKRSCLMGSPL